jgi:hypothetical protein
VRVELVLVARLHHAGIAAGARQGNLHRLFEELEALNVVDGRLCRLGLVEDDKGLALGLEVGLGHDVNHVAILGEDGAQGLLERLGLDALLEITDVDPASWRLVILTRRVEG